MIFNYFHVHSNGNYNRGLHLKSKWAIIKEPLSDRVIIYMQALKIGNLELFQQENLPVEPLRPDDPGLLIASCAEAAEFIKTGNYAQALNLLNNECLKNEYGFVSETAWLEVTPDEIINHTEEIAITLDNSFHVRFTADVQPGTDEYEDITYKRRLGKNYEKIVPLGKFISCTIDNSGEDKVFPKRIPQKYFQRIRHERSLLVLSNYYSIIRRINGGVSLAGEADENLDTVAYMVSQGIPLTKTFIDKFAGDEEFRKKINLNPSPSYDYGDDWVEDLHELILYALNNVLGEKASALLRQNRSKQDSVE